MKLGFAESRAESLWLSANLLYCCGYAAEAQPPFINRAYGKPEAFRKESGKAAQCISIILNR